MKCPFCGYVDSKVIDTRTSDDGNSIRRRRECLKCKKRFTTYEKVEQGPIIVIKKDGSSQVFDSDKLLQGMIRACYKRPVGIETLRKAVTEIEQELKNSMSFEVKVEHIGELAMEKLKKIDKVSYIRFASVYRKFEDVSDFIDTIDKITPNK